MYKPVHNDVVYAEKYKYERATCDRLIEAAKSFGLEGHEIEQHIRHRLDNTGYGSYVMLTREGLIYALPSDYFEHYYKEVVN